MPSCKGASGKPVTCAFPRHPRSGGHHVAHQRRRVTASDRQLGHAEGTPATTRGVASCRERGADEWTDQRANALLLDAAALAAIDTDDERRG